MSSLNGYLLIASPRMLDSFFTKTVVLLLAHSEEGAAGLIINRPTEATVSDLSRSIFKGSFAWDKPISLGGPVSGPLVVLHADEDVAGRVGAGAVLVGRHGPVAGDLVAGGAGAHPGSEVDRAAEVVAVAVEHAAGVDADARQRALGLQLLEAHRPLRQRCRVGADDHHRAAAQGSRDRRQPSVSRATSGP